MSRPVDRSFLALLTKLRWLAVAGQALTIVLVTQVWAVPLPIAPLWGAVAVLALFNLWASWRVRQPIRFPSEAVLHLAVDIAVLSWLVACSGGLHNPFGSLFLLPIALAALALPGGQVLVVSGLAITGYGLSAWLGQPLPHIHGGLAGVFDLHLTGMVVNFLVIAAVLLGFFARMRAIQRRQAEQVALLHERFTRHEGILALATHAASVAHELNTPLATLTLMLDERIEDGAVDDDELLTMRQLLDHCRDRVRELASPADPLGQKPIVLTELLDAWRMLRPGIRLLIEALPAAPVAVEPAVGHLLRALLDNAADASLANGRSTISLELACDGEWLNGRIRDQGTGFDPERPFLRPRLFDTGKADGLGLGLALSHATVERLGGSLHLLSSDDGASVQFRLPYTGATSDKVRA